MQHRLAYRARSLARGRTRGRRASRFPRGDLKCCTRRAAGRVLATSAASILREVQVAEARDGSQSSFASHNQPCWWKSPATFTGGQPVELVCIGTAAGS